MPENETYHELRKEALANIRADNQKYDDWWNQLSDERKEKYLALKTFSSDADNDLPFHLRKCRYLLEIISSLKTNDGKVVHPVGLAIHGQHTVVYI